MTLHGEGLSAGRHMDACAAPLLNELFPPGVVAYELRGQGDLDALLPEERRCIEQASPKRAREFAAGRSCAHAALRHFGIANYPVGVGEDRSPLWPEGICGSIAHTHGYCAAVVADRRRFQALGVDVEVVAAITQEIWPQICSSREIAWLHHLAPAEQMKIASLMFSAKEAFYKCQYPLTQEWLEFDDVVVDFVGWDLGAGGFAVRPMRPPRLLALRSLPWFGAFRFSDGLVLSAVAARA